MESPVPVKNGILVFGQMFPMITGVVASAVAAVKPMEKGVDVG
jgi:hypothetical protein